MTIPETSSEESLEHSEIANSKNSFFCYSDVHTKNKDNPNQNQNENLTPTLDFHKFDSESENFCKEIKNTTIQESIGETEWNNTKLPEVSGEKPKELDIK